MNIRVPLRRWIRPRIEALKESYPSGRPSFYPFPTVTNVVNAAFCPVAIYHDLLHGTFQDVTSSPRWQMDGVGNLFHEFIALLKSSIATGRLDLTGIDIIRNEFYTSSRTYSQNTKNLCWSHYLEPWVHRKYEELLGIKNGAYALFEITVSNPYVGFILDGSTCTYPITGIADEIDIENRRIVERTIKGRSNDKSPPQMKDYQLWLIWKIISSTPASKFPNELGGIDFGNFNLVVETPHRDFPIKKENPEFERITLDALAWIHDVAFDKKAGWEVYQNKRCTRTSKVEECGLEGYCFRKRQTFPTSRPEMRRVFKAIYRPLFWDQMWNWHLFKYQLVMLSTSELESLGLVSKGKIVASSENKIEVEVSDVLANQLEAYSEVSSKRYMIVPFGNFLFGKRLGATLGDRDGKRIVMEIPKKEFRISGTALILPKLDMPILESRPWYLSRGLQRNLFSLEYMGVKDPDKASKDSIVQLLESMFGQKRLRREGAGQDH